jgi:hypothetical protein
VLAPSTPSNVNVTTTPAGPAGEPTGTAHVAWTASTDNVGVAGYGVYRDGVLIATVTTPAFDDTGLAPATYTYTVDAFDTASPANRSAQSDPAAGVVGTAADVVAPSTPTNVAAATTPDIHGRNVTITWSASTDNVGVTNYAVYPQRSAHRFRQRIDAHARRHQPPAGTYQVHRRRRRLGGQPFGAVVACGQRGRCQRSAACTALADRLPGTRLHLGDRLHPGATYSFSLIRGGQTYQSAPFQADATGVIEVNHPGGTCWNVNTPDMRPGDVIRITDANGVADQTTVANVTAGRPIAVNANTVVIHGTAVGANGLPLPVDQIEQRLISSSASPFDLNGRRTLRAASAPSTAP